MAKLTKAQILQAMDDLDEGKPIAAELRHQVNLYLQDEASVRATAQADPERLKALEKMRVVNAWWDDLIEKLARTPD